MRRVIRTSMNVRAAGVAFAVLAHLVAVLLIAIERRVQRHEPQVVEPLVVSLWPFPEPPPPPPPPRRPLPAPIPTPVRVIAPVAVQQEAVATPAPEEVQPVEPVVSEPVVVPPIDWTRAAQDAADLYMANHNPPDAAASVRDRKGPRVLCRPREISKDLKENMNELLGRPPEPATPSFGPAGSVIMPGGQRVGVLQLPKKEPEQVRPAPPIDGERRSSVPDPYTCD
jgi:hypothetical protein